MEQQRGLQTICRRHQVVMSDNLWAATKSHLLDPPAWSAVAAVVAADLVFTQQAEGLSG